MPVLRARLNEKFARGAENQSFLVETISGIETVKAMRGRAAHGSALGQPAGRLCRRPVSGPNLANIGQEGVNLIGKLVGVAHCSGTARSW